MTVDRFDIVKNDADETSTGFYVNHDEDNKYRLYFKSHLVITYSIEPEVYISNDNPEDDLLRIIEGHVLSGSYDRLIARMGW